MRRLCLGIVCFLGVLLLVLIGCSDEDQPLNVGKEQLKSNASNSCTLIPLDDPPCWEIVEYDLYIECNTAHAMVRTAGEGATVKLFNDGCYCPPFDSLVMDVDCCDPTLFTCELDVSIYDTDPDDPYPSMFYYFTSEKCGNIASTDVEVEDWVSAGCWNYFVNGYPTHQRDMNNVVTVACLWNGCAAATKVMWGYNPDQLVNVVEADVSEIPSILTFSVLPWEPCVYLQACVIHPDCPVGHSDTSEVLLNKVGPCAWGDCYSSITKGFVRASCKFVIQWSTVMLSSSRVYYGTDPNALNSIADGPGDTYNHRVEIDASSYGQGTRIYFEVESVTECGEDWRSYCDPNNDYIVRGSCNSGKPPEIHQD